MQVEMLNEQSCIVYLGEGVSETIAEQVLHSSRALREKLGEQLIDLVPSYNSILVYFDLQHTDRFQIISQIKHILSDNENMPKVSASSSEIEIPVYYGDEVALDMNDIIQHSSLSRSEVIDAHMGKSYRVYAMGFSPGFSYLGSLCESIQIPRKSTPRLKVPAGSVGLADDQTAIYPSETPGGWQIIGRTPISVLDWESETLAKVSVGDSVRFVAIDKDTYLSLGGDLGGV
ncbi:allophanate hydrolase [Veronia nyctiphanis]|uniref:Allophanate hydrolase n=1 Tax=Veronia nyctiphanis TaxID=1278244 RepID=A0A4Q0YUQ2_9GAMM|nr:5-oxoprolinase subunit PxpB [Veronia nyctiphanis]RXJ74533.1 allophanate hydrolase [Veronia nyctiphanis]